MAQLYYSPISINAAQVPSAQTDFPVLVSQTDARFKTTGNGGHVANSSGFDIRPYSDTGLTLPISGYELERYNASSGEVIMWVKIGTLQSSTTPIYLGYGDTSLNSDGSSTTTWSNNFSAVYHLKDGTTLSVTDSTGNRNGTNHGVTAATGQIDGGGGFASASSQYFDTTNSISNAALTYSAWVNGTSFPSAYNSVISRTDGSSFTQLLIKSTGKMFWGTTTVSSGTKQYDGGTHTLSTGTWYYVVGTYDSSAGLIGYYNAASDGTDTGGSGIDATSITLTVGNDIVIGRYWNGAIDEARIASVARSADWITTEYNNQNAPGTFETLGAEVAFRPISGLYRIA